MDLQLELEQISPNHAYARLTRHPGAGSPKTIHELKQLARLAEVDDATAMRWLACLPVRRCSADRLAAALTSMNEAPCDGI